jgi:pimeloyl-ACP methyl ester carboxylesterase
MTDFLIQAISGAHWIQLENPDVVNALIRNFLSTL